MKVFLKTLKMISKCLMYVGYGATLVLLGFTVVDVVSRYVFNKPNSGMVEIGQILLIICMTCLAHAIAEGRWVVVSVFVARFPKKLNIGFDIAMGAIACVFFFIIGYELYLLSNLSVLFNEQYFILKTPRWPMYSVLSISFFVCVLATIVYVIERIENFTSIQKKTVLDDPELAILMGDNKEAKEGRSQ